MKNKSKWFTLIDVLIWVVVLWFIMFTLLGPSIWFIDFSNEKLQSLLINNDNKHFKKVDDYTLQICNIKTEGTIWNYELVDTNYCIKTDFFIPILRNINIDFYKVTWIFVNKTLEPIISFKKPWAFEIKNGVLFLIK